MSENNFPGSMNKTGGGSGCPSCGMDIVFTAYFDRFGFNVRDNKKNYSNIGWLHDQLSYHNKVEITQNIGACRTTWNYSYYASGLGTPHKPEHPFITGATLVLESVPDASQDVVTGNAKKMGEKAVKGKTLGQGISDVLKKETGMSTRGWKTNWKKYYAHRSVVANPAGISAKQVASATRMANKHAKDAVHGAARLGKSLARGALMDLGKAAALAALDGTEAADTDLAARLFRSGYKKRIGDAWKALSDIVEREKVRIKPPSQTCCGEVRVYIFGAEWGGTLARMFASKIVDECEQQDGKLQLDGIPVRICFVGLFDCANSISANKLSNSLLGLSPISTSLDVEPLAKQVEAAFHLFAAHERGYLLSSIADGKAPFQQEWCLPGISADVCGGKLLKGEYGLAHLDISKYALCQMHAFARSFGAPFASPDDGSDQALALDAALKADFSLNGEDIHTHLPRYLQLTDTAIAEPEAAIRRSTDAYVKWLRMLYDDADNGRELDRLLTPADTNSEAFVKAMKRQVRYAASEARRGVQLVAKAREHQAGKIWMSGDHPDDPFLPAFFAAYVHFNNPTLPLSFREVGE